MRQFIAFDERAEFPWKKPLPSRTREQDFLTMFDEGGCILVTLSKNQNISIPFLFGHGFYERIYYGDTDLSACVLKIDLDLPLLDIKDVLKIVDCHVAKILADRNYYKQPNAFCSMHVSLLTR